MEDAMDNDRPGADGSGLLEIKRGDTIWRFETSFLESNWMCLFGNGCKGILDRPAADLNQGCCSLGAHFGDGEPGRAEAMNVSAYADMLTPGQFEHHAAANDEAAGGIFGDAERTHTRVVDGACIFLNRPGFDGGAGCALHLGALAAGDAPSEWKPSVCWQLPLRIEWSEIDATTELATVRRWTRQDWGAHGATMAWCCTERDDGGEAYSGDRSVLESQRDELTAIVGESVYVELRQRLRAQT
jgi:hypothetical protein